MGWHTDDAADHEGYPVAVVQRGNYLYELRSGDDAHKAVSMLQAGCDCGWRSERIHVHPDVEWDGIVFAPQRIRDRLERLWLEHIALVLYRRRCGFILGPERRTQVNELLVKDLEGLDRCRCGHERRWHVLTRAQPCRALESHASVACICNGFEFQPSPP